LRRQPYATFDPLYPHFDAAQVVFDDCDCFFDIAHSDAERSDFNGNFILPMPSLPALQADLHRGEILLPMSP
jgi:hypothetical protein